MTSHSDNIIFFGLGDVRRRRFHMHYYAYVLLSAKDGRFYVGVTADLKNRLRQHAAGKVLSTKNRRYLKLIHYEYFINKADAKARELFLKSGAGHDQLRQILKRTLMITPK